MIDPKLPQEETDENEEILDMMFPNREDDEDDDGFDVDDFVGLND